MFVVDESRQCSKCGCTDYPYHAEMRGAKIIITSICLLCFREDDAAKSRLYYRRNKSKVQVYKRGYRQRPATRLRKNELERKYYRLETADKRYRRRERMRIWYQKNKGRLKIKKRKPHIAARPSFNPWRFFDFRSAPNK